MARSLRVEFPGARQPVTACGNERRNIFRDDRDRRHFLELVTELPERIEVQVVAWVSRRPDRRSTAWGAR